MAFTLFKKKKNQKGVIEALSEQLDALPSSAKVEQVVKVAIDNAELAQSRQQRLRSLDSDVPLPYTATTTTQHNQQLQQQQHHGEGSGNTLHSYSTAGPVLSGVGGVSGAAGVLLKPDCVVGVNEGLSVTEVGALEAVQKKLSELSLIVHGAGDSSSGSTVKEEEVAAVVKLCIEANLPVRLLETLTAVTFVTRAEVVKVFNGILGTSQPQDVAILVAKYVSSNAERLVELLLTDYCKESVALHVGEMLRKGVSHEAIYNVCLRDMKVLNYFFDQLLQKESFELVSDAFASFRELLQLDRQTVAQFLDTHYEEFFTKYNQLLESTQYITQRQSLKLLSDLLLDRQNYKVMIRYIGDKTNLILIMTLMRVKSPSMRLEAFHVFKIFVANPNKTEAVLQILQKNRDKLIAYLGKLTTEREEEIFVDEKKLVIRTLENIPPLPPDTATTEQQQTNDATAGDNSNSMNDNQYE